MSITTEQYTAAAGQVRGATEKSVELFKQGTQSFTDQLGSFTQLPQIDLVPAVERYFDLVQHGVDLNRELLTRWVQTLNSLTGVLRDQAETVSTVVRDQTDRVAELASQQAEKVEQAAKEQAAKVEQAEKEEARKVRQAQREQEKQAAEKAREPYQDLTKAELSDKLAERDLPKSGNVDELIDRLVEADTSSN